MADDVFLAKAEILERCVRRIREEYADDRRNLLENFTRQDSILLNLQRACEAAIAAAMRLVRIRRLGIPRESREAFDLLERAGILNADLAARLRRMVGFRNVAVHDYRKLDLEIVAAIVERDLKDFLELGRALIRLSAEGGEG